MAATGGSIESITLAGREFPVAADAEAQRKLGGFENEISENGDGSGRILKTRKAPMLSGVVVEIDDDRSDQEYIQDLADGNDFFSVAITLVSGKVYQGNMQFEGELQTSTQSATMPINLKGVGKLTLQ